MTDAPVTSGDDASVAECQVSYLFADVHLHACLGKYRTPYLSIGAFNPRIYWNIHLVICELKGKC